MILSASRRTDLPAFYGEWFLRRLRAGRVRVPNPFNPHQVKEVRLDPEAVEAIVFWTRHPATLIDRLPAVEALGWRNYAFLYTLTDYPRSLEPGLPPLAERLAGFRRLADRIGPRRITWRYDPIILSDRLTADYHARTFARLARHLAGATDRVVVSVVDPYRKTRRGLAGVEGHRFAADPRAEPALPELLHTLAAGAAEQGMTIQACAEEGRLAPAIPDGACLDAAWLSRACGRPITGAVDRGQRPACLCLQAQEVGVPDTCGHGCRYCYATTCHDRARERALRHDRDAPTLGAL